MQIREARPVGVELEERAEVPLAAFLRGPIEGIARQNQTRSRTRAIAVAGKRAIETMQTGESCAIGVDLEHRALIGSAAPLRRPEQRIARHDQTRLRISPVGASELVQVRETGAVSV